MNEEMIIVNEEIENTEVAEVEEPENSGNGIIGFVLGGLALAAGATAVVLHKTKDKREAKKIEKLRKKGYVIVSPQELEEAIEDTEEDFEEMEESTEEN